MITGLGLTAGLGIKVSGCGMAEVSGTWLGVFGDAGVVCGGILGGLRGVTV